MLLVKILRALAPLLVLLGTQVGLYFVLRELFASRPEQKRRRRHIALGQIALGVWLPAFFLLGKAGWYVWPPLRWLAQPLFAYHMLSVPVLLVLGLAISIARRTEKHAPHEVAPLDESRRAFLKTSAIGLFGAAAGASVVGIHTAEALPLVTRRDVQIPNLHPDLDGLTILQLSDVHAGMLMTEERMRAIAREASALGADVVVYTGDLLDMSQSAAGPFARGFRELHGALGTFAVLGNHDYYAGSGAAARACDAAGAKLLRNSGLRLERGKGSLWLAGVDDPACLDYNAGTVDFQRAMRGAAPDEARVMLCHRPSLFSHCAEAGAQLVLSGHTHGGQIALSRTLSMARLITPYTMGMYQLGAAQLYVHRGLGVVAGAPLRLGSSPELALLTLRRA